MTSHRRIVSSRANGALSHGPVTLAGKHCSSKNAQRHGLLSNCAVLPNESRENFEKLLDQYIARLDPADEVELGIVEEMVSAFWRMRRLWAVENRSLENALPADPAMDEVGRITAAFTRLAATPELSLMHRYETRLHRIQQRALHNLLLLRETVPNEPSPISEHPPVVQKKGDRLIDLVKSPGANGSSLSPFFSESPGISLPVPELAEQ
jgi:hypothetical protein